MNDQAAAQCQQAGAILGGTRPDCAIGSGNQMYEESSTVRIAVELRADHDFSAALYAAKTGHRVTRRGWNASGQWVTSQHPDKGSKMGRPYLYLKNAQNELVPWVPSQGDLFANDWAILPIEPMR